MVTDDKNLDGGLRVILKNKIMKSIFLIITIVSCLSLKKPEIKNTSTTTNLGLQELLMSKEWAGIGLEDTTVWKFTETEKLYYIKGVLELTTKYYISKTSCYEKSYNASLLGKESDGNYLVTESGSCESVVIENNDKIVFHHLHESAAPTFTLIAKK